MTQPDALLLLSGGIDSVQALHARCAAGERTRTHFVHLRNWEGRAAAEARAVRSALAWLDKRYPGLVTHTSSSVDYGDLRYIVRDHNWWGLWAGVILANPRNERITKVIRTFHRDSVVGGLDSPAGRAAERGWREPIERLTARRSRPVELVYPQLGMTKAEIIAALPADLLALCWYCRRPRGGRPCHQCHTCEQVDAALAGQPREPLDSRGRASTPDSGRTPDPPRGNASRAVWAQYAATVGVEVTDDMTRADIRAAVGH